MRRRIVALLQDRSEGLTTAEMRTTLGVERSLADTCLGIRRDGLLRRIERGRYVVWRETHVKPPKRDITRLIRSRGDAAYTMPGVCCSLSTA